MQLCMPKLALSLCKTGADRTAPCRQSSASKWTTQAFLATSTFLKRCCRCLSEADDVSSCGTIHDCGTRRIGLAHRIVVVMVWSTVATNTGAAVAGEQSSRASEIRVPVESFNSTPSQLRRTVDKLKNLLHVRNLHACMSLAVKTDLSQYQSVVPSAARHLQTRPSMTLTPSPSTEATSSR